MENKIKHLEFIQDVINRMASNSFVLKGWGITLFVGLYAFIGKNDLVGYELVAVAPLITFWFLDSFYLKLERKNRRLYDIVRQKKNDEIDFSMGVKHLEGPGLGYFSCLFSLTSLMFYMPSIVLSFLFLFMGQNV